MKIKSVHIDGFGKWVDQDFQFTGNPQVILGNNEAGKTTLAVFIRSVLFGFANGKGKNRYQQYKPRHSSAYGGSLLVEEQGVVYRIKRTTGKGGGKVTVVDQQGHEFGPQKLADLLENVDQDLYQAIFGFSQADLALGDNVDQETVQRHLQQVGAVGSTEWNQRVSSLLKQGDAVYKPRGRKPVLNRLLQEYQRLQAKIQAARAKFDDYQRLVNDQADGKEQVQQLQNRLSDLQRRLDQLERLNRLWPLYSQWQAGRQSSDQPAVLSDEQVTQADRLRIQEQELGRQVQQLERENAQLSDQAGQFDGPALDDFYHRQNDYRQLQDKLLQLQAAADHHQQQSHLLEDRFRERNQLQARYGHQLPKPLSERSVVQLQELLREEGGQPHANQQLSLGILVLGLLLAVLGLFGQHGALAFLGIIILLGAGWWYLHSRDSSQQAKQHQTARLTKFGQEHGLSSFPTSQWLPMQADLHRAAELNQELSTAQEGTEQQDQQFAEIQRRLAGKASGDSPAELVQAFSDWLRQEEEKWRQWHQLNQELASHQRELAGLKDRLRSLQQQKLAIYQSVGAADDQGFDEFLRQRDRAHTQAVTTSAYEQQLTAADRQRLSQFSDHDELTDQLEEARNQLAAARVDLRLAQERVQNDQLTINQLVADGSLAELEQRQANLAAQIWQKAQEWISCQLAVQWINRALTLASANRYPAIIAAAEGYFATLTGDHYQKIILEKDGVQVLTADQERFAVGELSTGTAEQLYIALRLGFANVMSDQLSLPVMIDDGFVNFDNIRRNRVLKILDQLADHNQVLYFTADDRARQLENVLDLNQLDHE